MDDMIRRCVDAKRDVFVQYFDVPPEVRPDMDSLMARIEALGEVSRNAQDFEARFAAELQPEYNAMFQRCRPRAVTMTKEQKQESKKLAAELAYGTSDPKELKKRIAKDVIVQTADHATTDLKSAALKANRERMIKDGTMRDYTIVSNQIENAEIAGRFLGGLFKKKKKKKEENNT